MAARAARWNRDGVFLYAALCRLGDHPDLGAGERPGSVRGGGATFVAGTTRANGGCARPEPDVSESAGRRLGCMHFPRRKFLKAGATSVAWLAAVGCDQLPRELQGLF